MPAAGNLQVTRVPLESWRDTLKLAPITLAR
jgi:hypothetical protein